MMDLISWGAESEALGQSQSNQSRQSHLYILQFCYLDHLQDPRRTYQLQEGIACLCSTPVPMVHDGSSEVIILYLLNKLTNII